MVKIMVKLMAFLVIGHNLMVMASFVQGTNSSNATDLSSIKMEDKIKSLDVTKVETRRKKTATNKKSRSTSSSSSGVKDNDSDSSVGVSEDSDSSADYKNKKHVPQSSAERTGWRKWHRKCPPCPEDMKKKWKDPSINWICGAYQRARRTFKSSCMMHYRNCQDGTMFVKIHDHRCENITYHGEHFLYDYKVGRNSDSSSSDTSGISYSGSDSDYR